MTTAELIRTAFPTEPLPRTFWVTGADQHAGDIPDELARRLAHRPWTHVTMDDWAMVGARPSLAKQYLHPDAFRYYVPSLLVGALQDSGYLDWALECLLPAGRQRRIGRLEWAQFHDGFSAAQRHAIRVYLEGLRSMLKESADPVVRHLIGEAEAVWSQPAIALHEQGRAPAVLRKS